MCIKFESRKICIAGNQYDKSDLDIHNAEDKKRRLSTIETNYCVTTVIAVTILLMLSILFSRVTVNVLVFVLHVVFCVTQYMYDARRQDFALSASFVSQLKAL